METQLLQLPLEVGDGEVGQQHDRVLVDVVAQEPGIEVVQMQMRDVEIVAVAESGPVQSAVVREHEPGCEICRVDPRVAQDAAGSRIDPKAGVADAGDLHE